MQEREVGAEWRQWRSDDVPVFLLLTPFAPGQLKTECIHFCCRTQARQRRASGDAKT